MLLVINDAVNDAIAEGLYLPLEDDESLTFVQNTYEYIVPATFVAVEDLRVEETSTTPSTWNELVPPHLWDMRLDSGAAKFFFHRGYGIPTAKKMKVIGQQLPTSYSALTATVDVGLEAFLRDRAAAHVLTYMVAGGGELGQARLTLREIKMRDSADIISKLDSGRFRLRPSSRRVPGR